MHKHLVALGALILTLLVVNARWVHAAGAVALSDGRDHCPESLVREARLRVQVLFGSVESNPWHRCFRTPKLGLGSAVGSTHFAPGLPSILVIGPNGTNADVLAHEWVHAEIAERIGVVQRTYWLPTWLDEGLAMQVDHRDAYGPDALRTLEQEHSLRQPNQEHLASPSGFFHPGAQGRLHYAWSRREVKTLLADKTPLALLHPATVREVLSRSDPTTHQDR